VHFHQHVGQWAYGFENRIHLLISQSLTKVLYHQNSLQTTGVARNFDWGGGSKMENFCDDFLVAFFDDIMAMTSLK